MAAVRIGDLLVQDGTISGTQLEEALKYQVIFGGKIGTNLIEMGVVDEDAIARVLAKKFGVAAATAAELAEIPRSVIARFPRELAEKYQALPLVIEGRRVTVATTDPGDLAAVDAIAFKTGMVVRPAAVSELRMAYALEKYYGIKRDRRFIHATRQFGELRRSASTELEKTVIMPPSAATAPPAPSESGIHFETVDDLGGTAEPTMFQGEAGGRVAAAPSMDEIWPDAAPAPTVATAPPLPRSLPPTTPPPPKPATPPAAPKSQARPAAPSVKPVVSLPVEEIPDAETVSDHLSEARDRDDILNTLAAFLACEFPRSALFLVRGDEALGWRATIDGASLPDFDQLRLPLSEPSVLKTVAESRSFTLGPIPRSPYNAVLVKALGGRLPEAALLVPLMMMGRVVAIFCVDGGGSDLGDRILELQKLTAKAAMAFEILVLKNKILSM